ncbi:hypothetical protein, partial [Leptospira kanakyensis]|uniref:hypothetical protein n=1 Tax=Leptospira kanakyensis TaxID=2484968 RepID=UPI00223E5F7B
MKNKIIDKLDFLFENEKIRCACILVSLIKPDRLTIILKEQDSYNLALLIYYTSITDRFQKWKLSIIINFANQGFRFKKIGKKYIGSNYSLGLDSAASIISRLYPITQFNTISQLFKIDDSLTNELIKRIFIFKDIFLLQDRLIAKILSNFDANIIAQASYIDLETKQFRGNQFNIKKKLVRNTIPEVFKNIERIHIQMNKLPK